MTILIFTGASALRATAQPWCDSVNVGLSITLTTYDKSFMVYVEEHINVQCNFASDDCCIKRLLFWRKEGQAVYRKRWPDGATQPEQGYEVKVNMIWLWMMT